MSTLKEVEDYIATIDLQIEILKSAKINNKKFNNNHKVDMFGSTVNKEIEILIEKIKVKRNEAENILQKYKKGLRTTGVSRKTKKSRKRRIRRLRRKTRKI
jgi:hypothetical protein